MTLPLAERTSYFVNQLKVVRANTVINLDLYLTPLKSKTSRGVQKILETTKLLSEVVRSVYDIWVPGYAVIISGNKLADKAAKEALNLPGR